MRIRRSLRPAFNARGFTLLEIAVVMIIIGILTGGGVSLMKILTERKARNETIDYLRQARAALINYHVVQGRLPCADTDSDGIENAGATVGFLPYLDLRIPPTDTYKRPLRYEVNANLILDRATSCSALDAGLTARPAVVDADGAGTAFNVAALLASGGPMDADNNGSAFDALNAGTHQGNNNSGTPNYLRHPPVTSFDDLTAYIGPHELCAQVCEFLDLAVNNATSSTVYVYDVNQSTDIGIITGGNSGLYRIISGTRIELRRGSGGGGLIVSPSTPQTPVILAGKGATINVP